MEEVDKKHEFTPAPVTQNSQWDLLRATVARKLPWLSRPLWALRGPYWRPGIRTAGVSHDGRVYIDPDVLDWPQEALEALLEHEVWHPVLLHADRRVNLGVGDGAFEIWNTAADIEIHSGHLQPNSLQALKKAMNTYMDGSKPCTAEAYKLPEGLSAEEYYYLLLKDAKIIKIRLTGDSSGADGVPRDYEVGQPGDKEDADLQGVKGWTAAERKSIQREVARSVSQASSRRTGQFGAQLQRWADEQLAPPTVDWQSLLRRSIQSASSTRGMADYSYQRPSRRDPSGRRGYISPGMVKPVTNACVVVDTSGSMSTDDLTGAMGEVVGIVRAVGGEVRAASCDAENTVFCPVRRVRDFSLVGGGGTDMGVGIAAAHKLHPKPSVCVVLTDGYTPWPEDATRGMSVIAVMVGEHACRETPPSWIRPIWTDPVPKPTPTPEQAEW